MLLDNHSICKLLIEYFLDKFLIFPLFVILWKDKKPFVVFQLYP